MPTLNETTFDLATAPNMHSKQWQNTKTTWAELIKKLESPIRTSETVAEYQSMTKAEQAKRKDQGGFVGGYLTDGLRRRDTVQHRQLVCLDADKIPAEVDFPALVKEKLAGTAYIIYSTHSHQAEEQRYRVIIPLSRPVTAAEYEPIARAIASTIGIDYFDPTAYRPTQLMHWPSAARDGEYVFQHGGESAADADDILGGYADWHDASAWPTATDETAPRERHGQKLGDPREKPGAIGRFCRAYNIHEAIAAFLPEVYTKTELPDRYTYAAGSTAAGVIVYDDGQHCYSHHATDPISGQDVNAFDLVRLNLFGELDEGLDAHTPINQHPSFTAMLDLVNRDAKVQALRSAEITSDFPVADTAWQSHLKRTKRGKIISTASNFLLILENDPQLKGMAGLDKFSHRVAVKRDLPWRKRTADDVWRDSDDAHLRNYISLKYGGLSGKALIDDAFVDAVNRHAFHQVKDYWDSLTWDGQPRVGTLLIDYLGAADTEYTRAVTTLFLKAAVARVHQPGAKFDCCLVLTGPQGIGKSTVLARLGGKWFNDSVVSLGGKDALEQLQGSLIVELAEMQAAKRAENDQIKAFISRQVDKFRAPYGHRTEEYPRQCVFAATTNDAIFLKDRTGGRRFLIVPCKGQGTKPLDTFTQAEVDQCWAEAVAIYRIDKGLQLSGSLLKAAAAMQEAHTEGAEKSGLVQNYLDTLLPDDWDTMDLAERRQYLRGEGQRRVGTKRRERVCVLEIWCELFENARATMRNLDARELNTIMQHMPGWAAHETEKNKSKLRFKGYGIQKAYIRQCVEEGQPAVAVSPAPVATSPAPCTAEPDDLM